MEGEVPMEVAAAGREEGGGEVAMAMAPEKAAAGRRRGCIRSTRGPWTVRRRGRGGSVTTSLRHPTPRERENNRQRERRRRQVATRIYAGLRASAGYALPKHADQNDVLRALCAEAGYLVDDDGNVSRRHEVVTSTPLASAGGGVSSDQLQVSSYSGATEAAMASIQHQQQEQEISLELTLSFTYM
ncbi:BES1/BZR1 homolog protein 1-like [Oryza brachyantha]|uniref:BES1/BZR1 homolog protein 1-like n=1 Tax=Oryza brachyantha TaxID=4533 RepID=UPI001ADAC0D6|nr:BES1/BZR1 homolog protein 1-like [Oryza brachyantha]